jgi:hypothetical protein
LEEIVKKALLVVIGFVMCILPTLLLAGPGQDLTGVYRSATVVSVTKVDTTVDYAYDIGFRMGCTLYVVRYKSAEDYLPIGIAPDHSIDVLTGEHGYWMHVVLSPDRIAELRVIGTQVPTSGGAEDFSGNWSLVQIGGDQVSYGQGYPVMMGAEVVGEYTSQGVLAYATQNLGTECRGMIDGNMRPQAFWVFSVHACGAYGFGDVKILHSGRTEPVGVVTLTSSGNAVKVGRSSGMLLRVDRSGAEETQAERDAARVELH